MPRKLFCEISPLTLEAPSRPKVMHGIADSALAIRILTQLNSPSGIATEVKGCVEFLQTRLSLPPGALRTFTHKISGLEVNGTGIPDTGKYQS